MVLEHVTIVRVGETAIDRETVAGLGGPVSVEHVSIEEMATAVGRARSRGAVVVVGSEVELALATGADEATPSFDEPIEDVVRRARARAAVRFAETESAAGDELGGLVLLSASVGHEINNPLAVASANCGMLQELILPFADAVDDLIDRAGSPEGVGQADIERLLQLVDRQSLGGIRTSLGDLAVALQSVGHVVRHMSALTDPEAPELCNLSNVVVDFATLVHHDVERVGELSVEVPDYPCIVAMGRARAIGVLSAIVQNSIAAVEQRSDDGKIGVRVSIDAGMVVLEVTDNGGGMSAAVRRQALNPFFTTRRPGALGMGLTFVARHVRQAEGEILLDSEEGVGTTVRIFLEPASTVPSTVTEPDPSN